MALPPPGSTAQVVRGKEKNIGKVKKCEPIIIIVEPGRNFIITKTFYLSLIQKNYFVNYPLSLKLYVQLSLIPKNPNRALR